MSDCIGEGCTHSSHRHGKGSAFVPQPKHYLTEEEYQKLVKENPAEARNYRPVERAQVPKRLNLHKVGRNEICPCGKTGKKYKHCCLKKQHEEHQEKIAEFRRKNNIPDSVSIVSVRTIG